MSSGGTGGSGGQGSAMMYLKPENAIVLEDLRKRLDPDFPLPTQASDVRVTDFDDVKFRIEVTEEEPQLVKVSVNVPSFADIQAIGVDEHLRRIYGSMLTPPYEGSDVTITVDTKNLGGAPPGEIALRVASLRRHILAWPFLRLMQAISAQKGASQAPFIIRTRAREPVYLIPRADRLTVVYQLEFEEATERAVGRLVAQELTESNRGVNNAPPCAWSDREPPMELKSIPGLQLQPLGDMSAGYVTFSLFPANHFKTEAQRDAAASHLTLWRNFLGYHLKAAKSYLHARMRSRGDALQKVLNRAIPEDPFADKEKKLASGKTFVRKS